MKKKLFAAILLVLCIALCTGVFVACSFGSRGSTTKRYTVTFECDGGDEIDSVKVTAGTSINLPEIERSGFMFAGWYDNEDFDGKRLSSPYKPTKSITLYAKWEKEEEPDKPHTQHTYGAWKTVKEPTCTEQGKKERVCACGDKQTESIPAKGHTEVIDEAVAATCTTDGKTAGKHCSVCNTILVEQTVIPKRHVLNGTNICSICGKTFISEGLKFTLLQNDSYEVSGIGTATDTEIYIPATYNGKPVTSIGEYAFYTSRGSSSITSVEIPSSVTSIGDGAFYVCSSITSIEIPNSVTRIGSEAFLGCNSLMNIEIPNGVTSIGEGAFYNCRSLTSIEIPSSVTRIGSEAFRDCNSLTNIEIPNGVTSIRNSAFYWCRSLTSIEIPNSVASIGDSAFYGCSSLTNIEIPNSVTSLGSGAFTGCSSFTSIEIPYSVTSIGKRMLSGCGGLGSIIVAEENTKYHSAGNCLIETEGKTLIAGCKASTIPSNGNVTSIGEYAFYSCGNLTSIAIPNSVTSIGEYAFAGCDDLTNIELSNSVTSIGECAFFGCEGLTSVTIPNSVTSIGNSVFSDCSSLVNIKIPNSVTSIGTEAFQRCSSLANVEIPNSVTSIGYGAFRSCSSLTNIEIPNSVRSIGSDAFNDCSSLTGIEIPNSVTSLGGNVCYGCDNLQYNVYGKAKYLGNKENPYMILIQAVYTTITECNIHENTKFICEYAFSGCYGLTNIEIPNGVISIGGAAFSGCYNLTSIKIPNGVTRIEGGTFAGCDDLTSIEIPNSVTSIGRDAFYECNKLNKVKITDIAAWCKIEFEVGGNPLWYANNLYLNDELVTELVIPDGVTSIGEGAFCNCSSLTSIKIPSSVTSIGNDAFRNCDNLIMVDITDMAAWCKIEFGSNPLWYANNLYLNGELVTELVIPDGVTSIGDRVFSGCSSITSIKIPQSVTHIGYAFSDCNSISEIFFVGTREEWLKITIDSSSDYPVTYSKWYFYSEVDLSAVVNCWHYDENGAIVKW